MMTIEEKILGFAALGTLAILILRPKNAGAATEGAGGLPPPPPPEWAPVVSPAGMMDLPPISNDPVVCQEWKTGNARTPWGTTQWAKVQRAVDMAMAAHFTKEPASLEEAKLMNFFVVRYAVALLCPNVYVPVSKDEYELERPQFPFWYRDLWDNVHSRTWNSIVASLGGGGGGN